MNRLQLYVILAMALLTDLACTTHRQPRFVHETRTAYWGYVEIKPVPLIEIRGKLDSIGCHEIAYVGESTTPCRYKDSEVLHVNDVGIEVNPLGFRAMGPVSFWITERRIWAGKDLSGPPDVERFKDAVRIDVESIGNIVWIKEDSWMILETSDATGAVY